MIYRKPVTTGLKKSVPGSCAAGYTPACWAAVY